jgi:hypothetical protein
MYRRLCRAELSGAVRCDDGDAPSSLRGAVNFYFFAIANDRIRIFGHSRIVSCA